MNIFALIRASFAAAAVGAVLIGHPVKAAPAALPVGLGAVMGDAEPFGLLRAELGAGPLLAKWRTLAAKLDDERVQLALCDGDREHCVSPAALRLLAIVDQARAKAGRARLGEINRAINLAVRPMSDPAQYGEIDVWASPLATFASLAGDCEDYAIAKFAALRLAGIAPQDLRIVILRDTARDEDHAVAAARLDGRWLLLDNQRMAMIWDSDARQIQPRFVIDESGMSILQAAHTMAAMSSAADAQAPASVPATN
ncbi:transglutaminase-like cysteine peptidase [Bradyrhizobium sp. SRS-191]|uniref:transglutaminase-like cysteine peptidase n=1 Tax=Bradyrhizobium sp. SRS-191 TaxID=2962606 RepID=UPI00211EA9C5|nr:transglutaminase-like cysteine peptidase [Bradyrhizobium sp. SRS-191]